MDEHAAWALQIPWWVQQRSDPAVQCGLVTVLARHWAARVKEVLAANKSQEKEPSTWVALAAALDIDDSNFYRHRTGAYQTTMRDFLAMASILRIPVPDLIPDVQTWIEETALFLCGGRVSNEEARAYTLYRLSGAACHNPRLDKAAVDEVVRQMRPHFAGRQDAENAILKTAGRLGQQLFKGIKD